MDDYIQTKINSVVNDIVKHEESISYYTELANNSHDEQIKEQAMSVAKMYEKLLKRKKYLLSKLRNIEALK